MKRNAVESGKITFHKNRLLILTTMIIFLIVTNLQSLVESAIPYNVSRSFNNSNFSNNTVGENDNSNNTIIEHYKIGVQPPSSTKKWKQWTTKCKYPQRQ